MSAMNHSPSGIDMPAAQKFLDMMAEGEPVTFQSFDDNGERKDNTLAAVFHGTLDQHQKRLQAFNARGAGIFWTVNYTDGAGRKGENVTGVRCVFVDLDGAPLQPVLAAGVDPHAVVESSPGKWHVYWQVTGCSLDQFKPMQLALAAKFNGDGSVNDLPRVLRVPGFVHHKGEPFVSRIISLEPFQPYQFDDLLRRLGLDLKAPPPASAKRHVDLETGEIVDKVPAGGRHAHLVKWAAQMNWRGMPAEAVRVAVHAENQRVCEPPKADAEVDAVVDDIVKRYVAQHGRDRANGRRVEFLHPMDDAPAWAEPMLPGTARVPEIGAELLGSWMGDMAAAVSASTQTPPAMAAMSIITVLAAVLQRRFEVAPYGDHDYREPLAVWTMVALGSGNRKTAVHKAVTQVLVDWEKRERDRLRPELARVAAQRDVITKRIETLKHAAGKEDDAKARLKLQDAIAELRDEMPAELFPPRLFSGDVTNERLQQILVEQDERIAVLSDEGGIFSIMLGYGSGAANFDVHLQGHAGSAMRVDRAGRMAHLDRPAVSFGLALQPGILQDTGKARRFRDSGLMARFLYAVPKSTVGTRDVRQRVLLDDAVRREYEFQINKLLDGMHRPIGAPRVLPFAADALECWLDLYEDVERDLGAGGRYAHIGDWASKLPGAAARIAGLLALAEHGAQLEAVPLASVQRAVALARLLIPHAEAAFALMGAADGETDAMALIDYIRRNRLVSVVRRDLQKAMEGRFRSLDRLLVAIKLLQDWNILGPEDKTRGVGRPSIFYQVNPRTFVDSSALSP